MDNPLPATTLTDAVPSPAQQRLALAVMGVLLLYSVAMAPLAARQGPVWPAFIGIYQTAVIVCDLLTAVLLLLQFHHFRQMGLLALGAGYLFTALIAFVHLLSFPGLFGEHGLIGGPQTTNWLWIIWHGAFPIFVLLYLLCERAGWNARPERLGRTSLLAGGAILLMVGGGTALATTDVLPPLIAGRNFNRVNETGVGPALIFLCLGTVLLVARERGRSVIKLWLAVAMLALTLEVFHSLHSGARYAVGWYVARGNSFVASVLILAVYVVENGILLRHWVVSSTQLAETNATLEQAKRKAEEVLSSITDGFYALDGDWRVAYMNQRAQAVLDKELPDVIGRQFFDVFPQVRDTDVHRIYARVMESRQPENFDFISPILRRWVSFSVYPAGDGGISVYFRDISDRKAAEEALIAAKEDAERANHAKSQFLASASHDLRQPVQSLYFFHEALNARLRGHSAAPVLSNMQVALDALKGLLDGLLDISKLHAGTVDVQPSDFPIAQVLGGVAAENAPRAAALGVDLRVVPSEVRVHSDRGQLERILRNLVDNALKYTPDGGKVLVGCRRAGDQVNIQVLDTGIGIPQESAATVFEEFVQLGNPERDRAKGLGLGLAIVRHLARLLDHEVTLRSEVGRGTCVSICVPLARSSYAAAARADAAPHTACGLALVVDDEVLLLMGMRAMLEEWGWQVLAAENGQEALRLATESYRPPDVIISDFRLRQGENGIAVIHEVRRTCGHAIPALVLTGDTSRESIAECIGSGMPFIHKPVDAAALLKALEEIRTPQRSQAHH